MRYFLVSNIVAILGLSLAYMWGGWQGLMIAGLLSVMEITLSFDNAVINAAVLKDMSEKWQQRFLTWGILVAVFGMRLLFPLVIVALATGLSIYDVGSMALEQPHEYSQHVLASHISIASFGGMFLLMVFFHYFFDEYKQVHWLVRIEKRLSRLGKLESAEVIVALLILLGLQAVLPQHERLTALVAGVVGVVLYVSINGMTGLMSHDENAGPAVAKSAAHSGFMGFMYLQVLDASFSLDGVIGAFAMSKDVVVIMLGLGIGAMFVRSMTVYIVRKGTLDEYIFLEHGAHYGIGALAAIMLASTMVEVSEVITGLIGVTFIGLALLSSVRYKAKK